MTSGSGVPPLTSPSVDPEVLALRERLERSEAHMAQTMMRATRLAQVISALGRQTDLESTVERACVGVSELFFADMAVLMLDSDAGLTIAGSWGIAESDLPARPFSLPAVDRFIGAEAVRTEAAPIAPLPPWLQRYDPRHVAWVRLTVGAKSVGLMLLARRGREAFEPSDATELRAVAYRIALAIENGILQKQMTDQLALLHRLQQLTTTLAGVIEIQEVGRLLAEMLVSDADVSAAAVVVARGRQHVVLSGAGQTEALGLPLSGEAVTGPDPRWHWFAFEVAGKQLGHIVVGDPPVAGSAAHEVLLHLVSLGGLSLDKALLFAESQTQARHDSLTGLLGHRVFHEAIEAEIAARRPFSILLFDIDDFKQVNDVHGHQMGDEALRAVSEALRRGTRAGDTVFRIGGEEFCALLPGLEAGDALGVSEKLRGRVAAMISELPIPVTVSVGVASFPAHGGQRDAVLAAADSAMYASKRGGKNRSSIAGGQGGDASRVRQGDAGLVLLHGKDPDTASHSVHVAVLAVELGNALALEDRQLDRLRNAARLHDIGKIAVPDEILAKPGPLDDAEFQIVKTHPLIGAELLKSWGLDDVATIVLQHHEHVDGGGYPAGLTRDQIQIEARIIHVADAYMAMTRDRPYRHAITRERAFAELAQHAGQQFDPDVVTALITLERSREQREPQPALGH